MNTKRISYSYPTSANAVRLGFGRTGCYTVDLLSDGLPQDVVAGFATSAAAWDCAESLPLPWDKLTRDRDGRSPLDQPSPIPARAWPRLHASVDRLRGDFDRQLAGEGEA